MRLRVVPVLLMFSAAAAFSQAGERQLSTRITGISAAATADGAGVEVTFTSSERGRDLILFWRTSPIAAPDDLLRSTSKLQLDAGASRYVVPTLPGVEYWFAVLDVGLFKVGEAPIVPGENATTRGAQVPLDRAATASAAGASAAVVVARAGRGQPLPSIQLGIYAPNNDRITMVRNTYTEAFVAP